MTTHDDSTDLFEGHLRGQVLVATAAALIAAAEAGLLDAVAEQPRTAAALAAAVDLHPDATARVLDMLVAVGVVSRDHAGRYAAESPLLAEVAGPSGSAANTSRLWSQTADYLRTGVCALDRIASEAPRGPVYATAVAGLGRLFRTLSHRLAERIGPVPGAARVFDVGAGSGQWSLAMASLQPEAHVTALDLPPVLPRFVERADAMGLTDRVATLAGDYHLVELPTASFDRIVVANVLHLETEVDAARLVVRLVDALAPGGQLVILDALPADRDDLLRPSLAAYTLSLGLRTGRGRAHPEPTLRRWLIEAGLLACRRVVAGTSEGSSYLGALVGERG